MRLEWISQINNIPFTALIGYIPVIATVITCLFSVILARATLRYVEATDKGLALAREEFEREWSPELHIKLERVSPTEARIVVTNLAKISVLLQLVQMRQLQVLVPGDRHFLNEPLVGGTTWSENLGKRLITTTGEDFEGPIAVCITFYASGRMYRTDWFRFQATLRDGRIARLEPVNISARRVQVIEREETETLRSEFVQDVASGELLSKEAAAGAE